MDEYEAVGEERRERLLLQARRGERGVRAEISRQERAAMDRYLAVACLVRPAHRAGRLAGP